MAISAHDDDFCSHAIYSAQRYRESRHISLADIQQRAHFIGHAIIGACRLRHCAARCCKKLAPAASSLRHSFLDAYTGLAVSPLHFAADAAAISAEAIFRRLADEIT